MVEIFVSFICLLMFIRRWCHLRLEYLWLYVWINSCYKIYILFLKIFPIAFLWFWFLINFKKFVIEYCCFFYFIIEYFLILCKNIFSISRKKYLENKVLSGIITLFDSLRNTFLKFFVCSRKPMLNLILFIESLWESSIFLLPIVNCICFGKCLNKIVKIILRF